MKYTTYGASLKQANKGTCCVKIKYSYLLTGKEVVNMIITNPVVIGVTSEGLLLREMIPEVGVMDFQAVTEPTLIVNPDLKEMEIGT